MDGTSDERRSVQTLFLQWAESRYPVEVVPEQTSEFPQLWLRGLSGKCRMQQ